VTPQSLEAGLLGVGLGPEFLARIHHTFLFRSLSRGDIGRVVQKDLEEAKRLASARGLTLEYSAEAVARPAALGDRARGVRHVEKLVRDHVTGPLAILAYEGRLAETRSVRLETGGGSRSQHSFEGDLLTLHLPSPAPA